MPYRIIRDDISRVRADAIVCSASPEPGTIGGGEAAIHAAAGDGLMRARYRFGRLEPGAAVVTKAYGLHARYVIHAVGPIWRDGKSGEIETLHLCYRNAISTAISMGCRSAAFPLISSGHFGFSKSEALHAAIWEFQCFSDEDIELILVVYDQEAYELSAGRFRDVAAYIDDNYVGEHPPVRNGDGSARLVGDLSFPLDTLESTLLDACEFQSPSSPIPDAATKAKRPIIDSFRHLRAPEVGKVIPDGNIWDKSCTSAETSSALSLEERMHRLDAGFSETLLKLIDESGCTDAEIYKRANVSRKLFSKIRSAPDYRPSKPTALAFCVALRLNPAQARELLSRAGYALSHSSRFDVIVEYYLEKGVYDILEINEALFCFDQPLLGSA